MTTDTRVLTSDNVSLRPSGMVEGMFIVDLHSSPYDDSPRRTGVGALMTDYTGGYTVYDWTHNGVEAISERGLTMSDAILAITQHLSPYTF